jgi:hypothetical protein
VALSFLPAVKEADYMNIYLAGPMRGYPEFNFPAFHAAAAKLRAEGHYVFNPAERDIERHGGVDISKGNRTGDVTQAERDHGFNRRDAMGDDLDFICRKAHAIALLPGWQASEGANLELTAAKFCQIKVIEL